MSRSIYDLATLLGDRLLETGWRVAAAESCTGGGVAEAITRVPGCSQWFEYGFVTYADEAKIRLLGVSDNSLASHGAVSEAVARQMAAGAREVSGAQLAVAVTGIAGPDGGTTEKPVGTVHFAWAGPDDVVTRHHRFSGDRAAVREQSVRVALEGLIEMTTV